MREESVLRLEVPGSGALDRLVESPLPLGLRGSAPVHALFRDVYFDTPDGALRRAGVTCCLRHGIDDRRTLAVTVHGPRGGRSVARRRAYRADVSDLDARSALAAPTEPGRVLQAVVDPGRLGPTVELATERRSRRGRHRVLPIPRYEFHYDLITARSGELTGELQELEIRPLRFDGRGLEEIAAAFREEEGLKPILGGRLERARGLLEAVELEVLSRAVRGYREAAVIPFESERIGLCADAGILRVLVGEGSGERAARAVLRDCFGSGEGQLRFLGTAPATGSRPVTEVWLARRVRLDSPRGCRGDMEWLALDQAIALVGSPSIRDARTLAALHVAARSDLMRERLLWRPVVLPGGVEGVVAGDAEDDDEAEEWMAGRPSRAGGRRAGRTASAEAGAGSRDGDGEEGSLPPDRALRGVLPPLTTRPILPDADLGETGGPEQFINAKLSLLAFNERVLELAEDPAVPLLARVRFLSIFSRNLDEFYMVRVGALKDAVARGSTARSEDGLTAGEELDAVATRARRLFERAYHCLFDSILPALRREGIRLRRWPELTGPQKSALRGRFERDIEPLLTPLAASPGHPFPRIPGLGLALAAVVRDPASGVEHFSVVTVPDSVPRFIPVPKSRDLIPVEAVIRPHLGRLFTGAEVLRAHAFRVTRSGVVRFEEGSTRDLLRLVEEEVEQRPFGPVVRLEVERVMPREMRELLLQEFRFEEQDRPSTLSEADIHEVEWLPNLGDLEEVADLPLPEHHYPPFRPAVPVDPDGSIFDRIREGDLFVHHPYNSFDPTVQRLFREAARDPDVLGIKVSLYRTEPDSAIVGALQEARRAGKEVVVLVELKARWDEERNIEWARTLGAGGLHVVYGLLGLKLHAKIALVVRREPDGVRRYCFVGTGNLNAVTAAQYTDLGLITADPELAADVATLFNDLTGYSPQSRYEKLLVSPAYMLPRFLELIEREAAHARAGRGGRIRVKVNGLSDPEIVRALYRASQAGVDVDLIVRGICTLRPRVPGLSERVRVVSILGRFLEHARIFHFENGGEPEYYIGSADWRPRNLRRRVEVVAPVEDPAARARLDHILDVHLADPAAWELRADGSYVRRARSGAAGVQGSQERLLEETAGGGETAGLAVSSAGD